mgnify:CR=1 FL=1
MRAMIFAAGLGTRLKPLTDTMPKALVPLAGKTLLQWQIEKLKGADIRDITVNVHHFPDQIIDYLRDNANFGCQIHISDERNALLDTGGGLRNTQCIMRNAKCGMRNEPILVCNVDILSNIDLRQLIAAYRDDELGVLVVSERDTQRYLLFDAEDRLHGWTNISTGEVRPEGLDREKALRMRKLAFSGMQVLSPRIFDVMDEVVRQKGDKFSLIDLYLTLTEREVLRAYVPKDYRMMDVGKIGQIAEAEAFAESLYKHSNY